MRKKTFTTILVILIVIFLFPQTQHPSTMRAKIVVPTQGNVYYCYNKLNYTAPLLFVTGRLYVPFDETTAFLGDIPYEDLRLPVIVEEDIEYISLYDAANNLGLWADFVSGENKVFLIPVAVLPTQQPNEGAKDVYFRFEDVVGEGNAFGSYTDFKYESMRVMADYMHRNGQCFAVSWIPMYINPEKGIENDLTTDFSFYNADFLFTLDYMTDRGGELIIHGLTHQSGNDITGVGYEFGTSTALSEREAEYRIVRAQEIAEALGLQCNAFEFPHYSATNAEIELAQKYYDKIYQQKIDVKSFGNIEKTSRTFNTSVMFIPTPMDYMDSPSDAPEFLKKFDALDENTFAGMMFHPMLEYANISFSTSSDGIRSFTYSENGILPQLVEKARSCNMKFAAIP